jgi:DnaK suppressor protein
MCHFSHISEGVEMDAIELAHYEQMLQELQTELRDEIENARRDTAPVELDGTMGRISRGDAMQVQQMALEMKRRRQQRLQRVGAAFERIKQGRYGRCGRCRKPIGTARLETFPDVVLCVKCAAEPRR